VAKKARTPKPPRAAASGERRVQAPQRRAGPAKKSTAAAPPAGMRYFWPIAAVVVALAIVGIVLGVELTRGSSKPPALALTSAISWKDLPALQTGKPPWSNDSATLSARITAVGLTPNTGGQLAYHIHPHLDLYVNGQHVPVPADIGIHLDAQSQQSSFDTPLHTHDSSGIVHVEPEQNLGYVLGQFFGEWGVRLTSKCLGSFNGSCDNLEWWLNGVKQSGNPANLVLKNHQEIVVAVGKRPAKVPTCVDFGAHNR
jgi:hypothetical protein